MVQPPNRFLQARAASSSTARDDKIPPESPKYIFVPLPPQPQKITPKPMKGLLPRPRKVFQRIKDKGSEAFLAAAVPEPKARRETQRLPPEHKARVAFKAEEAAARRQNLREGLRALRERKHKEERRLGAVRESMRKDYERRVHAPEREDERLTRPTLLRSASPLSATVLPDPHHAERMAEKRRRYQELQAAKDEERLSALHTLYINSKDFIVSQADLEKKVSAEFDKPFYQNNPDRGIWDEEGYPEDLRWLVAQQAMRSDQYAAALGKGKPGDVAIEQNSRLLERSMERAQRIADELTGGKA